MVTAEQEAWVEKKIDERLKSIGSGAAPKLKHEQIAEMIPKGVNFMSCPGNDCHHQTLTNHDFTKEYKTCPNCRSNTNHIESKFCSTCGKEPEKDDWQDSDVEIED